MLATLVAVLLALIWWLRGGAGLPSRDSDQITAGDEASRSRPLFKEPSSRDGLAFDSAPSASIGGTVRDETGEAIAGARVCATQDRDHLRGRGSPRPSCVTTDGAGRYRIEGLVGVRTHVDGSAERRQPQRWVDRKRTPRSSWIHLEDGALRDGIDLVLLDGGVLVTGAVRDLTGGEIEGASVTLGPTIFRSNGEENPAHVVSDANGNFRAWVAPGTTSIEASAEGYAPHSVSAAAPSESSVVYLTPESVLVGRVLDAQSGRPLPELVIRTHGDDMGWRQEPADVLSDGDGRFRVRGLAPGRYSATASNEDLYGEAAPSVSLGLGETSVEIEIPAHRVASVSGRVLIDEGDTGCEGAYVRLTRDQDGRIVGGEADPTGRVTIYGVRTGSYTLEARCEGYQSGEPLSLSVSEDAISEQVWRVRSGLTIRGMVVDAAGDPVPGATVGAYAKAKEGADPSVPRARASSRVTERDGTFIVSGLPPGTYELNCYGEFPVPPVPIEVELTGAGKEGVILKLAPNGTIAGRVVDEQGRPQPQLSVQFAAVDDAFLRGSTITRDDGTFTLENVVLGNVRLTVLGGPGWGSDELHLAGSSDEDGRGLLVTVGEGTPTNVELRVEARGESIRGKVLDGDDAPVADAFVSIARVSDSEAAAKSYSAVFARHRGNDAPVLTDADGKFEVTGLAAGKYAVFASRRGGGETTAESVATGSIIELRIEATGEISGVVHTPDGGSPTEFTVQATAKTGEVSYYETFFQTQGQWTIPKVSAGTFTVSVASPSGSARVEDVVLKPGESKSGVLLTLEPRVTIKGRLVDLESGEGVPGTQVVIGGNAAFGGPRGRPGKEVSDAQGYFEVANVPVGPGILAASSTSANYDFLFRTIAIPSEPAVQTIPDVKLVKNRVATDQRAGDLGFDLKQRELGDDEDTTLLVAVVRANGPAKAAGLKPGDIITAVDGHSVLDENKWNYYPLTHVPEGTQLAIDVLRDGKPVSLSLIVGAPR